MADNPQMTQAEQAYFDSRGEKAPIPGVADPPPAAPAPEQEPAPVDQQDVPADQAQPENRMVPHAALHEERQRRKEAEARMRELEERTIESFRRASELEARLNAMTAPEQPRAPSVEDDPVAVVKDLDNWRRDQQRRDQAREQHNALLQAFAADGEQFASKAPDYVQALEFWAKSVIEEAQLAGYPPDQARAYAAQTQAQIVARAMMERASAAERLYTLAKRRGYAAPAEQTPRVDPERALQAVARGQESSRSLASSGGTTQPRLSIETALKMSREEFGKLSEDQFRRLAGG